jgi:hypothetical protein
MAVMETRPVSKRRNALKRNFATAARWLHIYGSMISFAIVLFFSVTGITLNHPDFFAGEMKTLQEKGKLNPAWVNTKDTLHIAKLQIVEALRKAHSIKAPVSEFRIEDDQCTVSFKGPGYAADAFITRNTGNYEITLLKAGVIGIMNDLHKGRDSGSKWAVVIDVAAALMLLISLSGLVLLLYIKRKRLKGLVTAVAGVVIVWVLYKLFIG